MLKKRIDREKDVCPRIGVSMTSPTSKAFLGERISLRLQASIAVKSQSRALTPGWNRVAIQVIPLVARRMKQLTLGDGYMGRIADSLQ